MFQGGILTHIHVDLTVDMFILVICNFSCLILVLYVRELQSRLPRHVIPISI